MDHRRRCERLIDRYRNGDVDRRSFLGLLGLAATASGVGGPAMALLVRHAHAATELRYDGWGGVAQDTIRKYVLTPFEQKTGAKVNEGSYGSTEQFLAKVLAGQPGQYHYFSPSTQLACLSYIDHGYGVALDEKKIPKLAYLIPKVVDAYRTVGKGTLPGVPSGSSIQMLAYNREKIDASDVDKQGVNILLDPKYKGKIAGEDYWLRRMLHAALQSKQNPNAIANIDAVWEKIRDSKKVVFKYWRSGAELMNLLATGEALLTDAWGVRVYNLRKQGYPIEPYVPEGAIMTIGAFMPLKGAPLDPYYEMVDILLEPDVQIAMAVEGGAPPLIDPNKFPIPAEVKAIPAYDPTGTLAKYTPIDAFYWNKNEVEWQKEYRRVLARG